MWQKFKDGVRNFMIGRNGADQLSMAMLIAGIVLSLLTLITKLAVFNFLGLIILVLTILGFAAYVFCVFRMFSRNLEKRRAENQKFVNFRANFGTNAKQLMNRLKNMKKYKYFKCPQCGALLRLPRKVGEVTVTCGKCKNQFKQKA